VKAYELDILASAVLRYFEQVEATQKSRLARQIWRNIRKSDRFDGVHLDLGPPPFGIGRPL
jgi:hypothetical protein